MDDVRPTPQGWVRCYWPEEVIDLLKTGKVIQLSLDHDLGDIENDQRNGYAVLLWLEEQVVTQGFIPPETISVHSDNSSAREKMERAIQSVGNIKKIWRSDENPEYHPRPVCAR